MYIYPSNKYIKIYIVEYFYRTLSCQAPKIPFSLKRPSSPTKQKKSCNSIESAKKKIREDNFPISPVAEMVYTHKHTHTHTYTKMHANIHTYIHTLTHIHTYVHECIHTYIHTCIRTYILTHTHTHTHTNTRIHTQSYTYTHISYMQTNRYTHI